MDDLISRAEAIDAIIRHESESYITINNLIDKDEARAIIEDLPSAQPTFDARDTQYNLPIGTDCISRQAAIDTLENTKTAISENGERYIAKQNAIMRIDALPSAQPKRGKWILDRSGAYCCSECMEPCATYVMMKPRDKFCKMCGAKMEVTE